MRTLSMMLAALLVGAAFPAVAEDAAPQESTAAAGTDDAAADAAADSACSEDVELREGGPDVEAAAERELDAEIDADANASRPVDPTAPDVAEGAAGDAR